MQNNQFGGVFIPREVLLDDDIPSTAKILYGFVQSLDGERGCFASNSYLAGLVRASEETVRASLYLLEKKGYIARLCNDGGHRVIRTRSSIVLDEALSTPWGKAKTQGVNELTPTEIPVPPTEKSVPTPPEKSGVYIHNNTDSNDNKSAGVDYQKDSDFLEVWKEFKKYRKKMRRPLTDRAEELVLKKLANTDKATAIKALELSIERSWIGVFPEAVDYSLRKNNGRPLANANEPLTDGDHVTF